MRSIAKSGFLIGICLTFCFSAIAAGQVVVPARQIRSSVQPAAKSVKSGGAATTPPVENTPEAAQVDNKAGTASAKKNTSVAQSTDKKKLAKVKVLQFNRSPGSILKVWSQVNREDSLKVRPEPPGPDNSEWEKTKRLAKSVQDFEYAVILGQWDKAREFIDSFENKSEAQQVYEYVLTKLKTIPTAVTTPSVTPAELPPGVTIATPTGVQPDDHLIAPKDFVGLVLLAPVDLSKQHIDSLGLLLSKSVRQGFDLADIVARFEKGIANIGGAEGDNRANAARILLAAGKPRDAALFVKTMEQATQDGDAVSVVLNSEIARAKYNLDRKPELLLQAWKANQSVLATSSVSDSERQNALQYAVTLAPKIEIEIGESWLKKSFTENPKRGIQILAGIGQATADGQNLNMHNISLRLEGLKLQKKAVTILLDSAPEYAAQWNQTLNLLAMTWLKEAKLSRIYARSTGRPLFRRDRYGNIYYASNDELRGMIGSTGSRPQPIPVQDILETRPEGTWFSAVDPGLQKEFEELLARLYLKNAEERKAFPFIESIAQADKKRARKLVDEFLEVWTRNHNPNENVGNRNRYIYFFGFEQRANSIPLTRSKQQRNLKELQEWIARIRKMELTEIDEEALVRAFTTCHSTAEVYRIEDIEEVFGSIQKLKPNTVAGLVQKMRANLSTAWRQPRVQEEKKTNRKEPEIQREVQRGYEVAANVTRDALFEHPDSWELLLAKACINFDRNAYQQEVQKSSEFTEKQRKVFGEFAEAAKVYANQVASMDEADHTTEVFDLWFYASLGACDLALLTHEKLSVESQFELIRSAMDALPGEAPRVHLAQFANKLFTRMSPLKPEMKYRYLKGGFAIVGDHPDAAEAYQVFQYYNDLVTEIQLKTEIDGSDVVGTSPFGLFVYLYHTEEVERESGGFSKYLQNQNNMTYAYNYGRPTNDYRDAFETSAIEALSEHFEVISVTFEDEKNIESRESNEAGWRVTPYAYLLLKARGEEVDIIPPVKLDLDFLDTSGYAVLPIESKGIPVDTREALAEPRPMKDLNVVQTLDERRSGEGKLVLEVKATARGLIPELERVIELRDDSFEIIEQQDQGVSVSAFDPESSEIQVIAEREWLVELKAREGAGKPSEFRFGDAVDNNATLEFKRYVDADLVSVQQSVPLENEYGKASTSWLYWLAGGGSIAMLLVVLGALLFRSPKSETVVRYQKPDELTPLSVIGLLKQIRDDQNLGNDHLVQLDDSIHKIEEYYFLSMSGEVPNLEKETDHWLSLAN